MPKKIARIIGNGLNLGFVKKNLGLGKNSGVFMVKEDLGFGKKTWVQEKLRFLWWKNPGFWGKKTWVLKNKTWVLKRNIRWPLRATVVLLITTSVTRKEKTSNSDEISYLSYSINFLTWNLIKSAEKERSFPLVIAISNIFGLCA